MTKKLIRLTESDLHNIVKESVNKILNEAYGTPDKGTRNSINSYRHLEDWTHQDSALKTIWSQLLDTRNSVDEWVTYTNSPFSNDKSISRKYADILVKQIDTAIRTCKMIMNKRIMNQGEQPDENYFNR